MIVMMLGSRNRGWAQADDAELLKELGEVPAAADPAAGGGALPAGACAGLGGRYWSQGTQQSVGVDVSSTGCLLHDFIFLALSITLLTLIVMNLIAGSTIIFARPILVEGVEQHLAAGQAKEAAELVRTDDSLPGTSRFGWAGEVRQRAFSRHRSHARGG